VCARVLPVLWLVPIYFLHCLCSMDASIPSCATPFTELLDGAGRTLHDVFGEALGWGDAAAPRAAVIGSVTSSVFPFAAAFLVRGPSLTTLHRYTVTYLDAAGAPTDRERVARTCASLLAVADASSFACQEFVPHAWLLDT